MESSAKHVLTSFLGIRRGVPGPLGELAGVEPALAIVTRKSGSRRSCHRLFRQ